MMFGDIYRGKKVLVTGHTGFKGSWLVYWLRRLGAEVCGVALPMEGEYNHFELLNMDIASEMCDIRNLEKLKKIVSDFEPEIIFHLAAQALVRPSYREPAETFAVNVMGTVNLLEAARLTNSVRAVVAVTSDKCYENRETERGYREDDPMGGYDPYSASKGCTELAAAAYRRSFFNNADFGVKHNLLLASARAGNVVGGGDWAADRLIPDLMKAAAAGKTAELRSPGSVRPWQHVLEPLSGYLLLGEKLLEGKSDFAAGWNFGPDNGRMITVKEAAEAMAGNWSEIKIKCNPPPDAPHEAKILCLDCSRAGEKLNWHGVWTPEEAFAFTAEWYREFYRNGKINTAADLDNYVAAAEKEGLAWTK